MSTAPSAVASAPFPADVGPILDMGAVLDRSSDLDGSRLAMRGIVLTDGRRQRFCSGILESFPIGCGSPTITLVGDLPGEVLDQLDDTGAPSELYGEVEVAGTFHASGANGEPRIDLEAARMVPVAVVGEWKARCLDVAEADCIGAAERFINLLARSGRSALKRSGGVLSVWPRSRCPTVPDDADGSFCWQVLAETALPNGDPWCMVIARRSTDERYPPYVHVGGPDGTGRAGGMPDDWPTCE